MNLKNKLRSEVEGLIIKSDINPSHVVHYSEGYIGYYQAKAWLNNLSASISTLLILRVYAFRKLAETKKEVPVHLSKKPTTPDEAFTGTKQGAIEADEVFTARNDGKTIDSIGHMQAAFKPDEIFTQKKKRTKNLTFSEPDTDNRMKWKMTIKGKDIFFGDGEDIYHCKLAGFDLFTHVGIGEQEHPVEKFKKV